MFGVISLTEEKNIIDNEKLMSECNISTEHETAFDLTVMTYNVQFFSGRNTEKTAAQIINHYKPDIVGVQELGDVSSIPSEVETVFSGYEYEAGIQRNKSLIASLMPLKNYEAKLYRNNSGETRGYQKAYVTVHGRQILWINTHHATSSYEAQKIAQAEELFNLVKNEPCFIITGDFNTVCKSTADNEYAAIMKQFIDAGFSSANCCEQFGFINTWTSSAEMTQASGYPCDHIITNMDIVQVIPDEIKINAGGTSSLDHIPLVAWLKFKDNK